MKKIVLCLILLSSITCHAADPEPEPQGLVQKAVTQTKKSANSLALGVWVYTWLFCCGIFPFPR